jgi:ribosomal 30S subunit maturation factor RimM
VRLTGATTTQLIPFSDAFVPQVDLIAKRAVVVFPGPQEEVTLKR